MVIDKVEFKTEIVKISIRNADDTIKTEYMSSELFCMIKDYVISVMRTRDNKDYVFDKDIKR